MKLEKIAEFFSDISNIPATIMSRDGQEMEFGIRSFKPSLAQFYISPILNEQSNQTVDVTLTEDMVICGYVIDMQGRKALILGPVMEHPCSRSTALNMLKHMGLSYKRADELMYYFEKIPSVALTTFIKELYFLNYIINDQLPPAEDWYKELAAKLGKRHTGPVQTEKLSHNPREWDQMLEACIEYGKMEELETFMASIRSHGKMGITANDSIRSFKNVSIASIALISRAAARGGMDYEAALSLSDEYIRKIETLRSFEELNQLLGQAFFEYTGIVARIRRLKSQSKLVYSVVNYVQKHIFEPIQVTEIAEEMGNNVSYLCRNFKQETGKTLKEYINEVKLEEAKFMLRSTEKPIIDIAMELGYSSQAYFATLFKNYTGSTPMNFREKTI